MAARGAAKEELYREMLASRIEEVLVPGLRPFLDRYRGAPLAVASNAEPENVAFVLDRAGLRGYFRVVVDGHQVTHPKPHPEIYLRAAACWQPRQPTALSWRTRIPGSRPPGRRECGLSASVRLMLTCRIRT